MTPTQRQAQAARWTTMDAVAASIVVFHAPLLMKIALDARDRAIEAERSAAASSMSDDALVAIVMAAASAEAFINELAAVAESFGYSSQPAVVATGSALSTIENDRGSTELKYLIASLTLSGAAFKRGVPPFQDFATLMKLRNDLMHARPRDEIEHSDGVYVSSPPAYIRDFEQRGMTVPRAAGVSVSWLNLLQSAQMATQPPRFRRRRFAMLSAQRRSSRTGDGIRRFGTSSCTGAAAALPERRRSDVSERLGSKAL